MRLKKVLKELLNIKIVLSVIGAFFVGPAGLLMNHILAQVIGHIIWFIASIAWLKYFYDKKDDNAIVMYWIWILEAIGGIICYGLKL